MAALFNSSANGINTAALPGPFANLFGSPTVGNGDGPQGINTIHCNGASNAVFLPNIAVNINGYGLILGAGFNVTGFGSSATGLISVGSNIYSGVNSVGVVVGADGSMQIVEVNGGGAVVVVASSGSGVFTFGNRHEVEMEISAFASSGTVTVYLDGVAVTNLTAVVVSTLASLNDGATVHSVVMGALPAVAGIGGTPIVMDSTYAFDTTGSVCNAPVGPAISVKMVPNGVGHESQWTPNGAALGWECIDDIPPDGDTTYISSATANQEEAVTLSAPTGISGVYCISVIGTQRQDTAGGGRTTKLGLGNGATQSYGSAWPLGTTYVGNTTAFSENPFTSAPWALSDLTGLQVACQLAT